VTCAYNCWEGKGEFWRGGGEEEEEEEEGRNVEALFYVVTQ
jgi:hypothetical protein